MIVRCSDPADTSCADFQTGQIKPGAPQSDTTAPNLMSRRAAPALQAARDHRRPLLRGLPGRPVGPLRQGRLGRGLHEPAEPHEQGPDHRLRRVAARPGLDPDCVNSQTVARAADLALRPGRHGRRLDLPRPALRRQQLRRHVRGDDAGHAATGPAAAPQPTSTKPEDAITTNGGFGVWGVVAVDGQACLKLGSNGVQVSYDATHLRRGRVLRHRRPRAEHLARARPEGVLKAR